MPTPHHFGHTSLTITFMFRATTPSSGPPLIFEATVSGLPVYLDNHAIISLSKNGELQDRFIASLKGGADLMFSIVNAVELIGPQGKSSEQVRAFLDRVGPHWFPVTIGTQAILDAEAAGHGSMSQCVSQDLVKAFFDDRTAGIPKPPPAFNSVTFCWERLQQRLYLTLSPRQLRKRCQNRSPFSNTRRRSI